MKAILRSFCAALAASLLGASSVFAGWNVDFEQGFVSSTGQAPSNTMGAKLIEGCPTGTAVLLEKKARLAYSSLNAVGEPFIAPVKGKLEFDFFPDVIEHSNQAAFDSGNIILLGRRGDSRLWATLRLDDGTDLKLVSKGELPPRRWSKITLIWNVAPPAGRVVLLINGEVAAQKEVAPGATRLKDAAASMVWGMFLWGGNPWNGTYDNLTIE